MKSKVILSILAIVFLYFSDANSQYLQLNNGTNLKQDSKLTSISKPPESKFTLGAGIGFAFNSGNTGVAVSMFSEMKFDKFSFVPSANYWKVEKRANFEMGALGRYTFSASNIKPYIDAGLGFNFYDNKEIDDSFTKLGLSIGGGVDFNDVLENAIIFIDGKYKVIVSNGKEGNIESYTLIGGIKFIL